MANDSIWIGWLGPIQFTSSGSGIVFPGTVSATRFLAGDGTAAAPALAFTSESNSGLYRFASNTIGLSINGTGRVFFGTANTQFQGDIIFGGDTQAIKFGTAGDTILSRGAANRLDLATGDSWNLVGGGASFMIAAVPMISSTAPTIASGFGSSPSIPNANGTAAFTINVGTGGTATGGVLTMPAATTGWVVDCVDITNASTAVTVQTAGTTTSVTLANYSRTTGLLTAWAASDIIRCKAMAY